MQRGRRGGLGARGERHPRHREGVPGAGGQGAQPRPRGGGRGGDGERQARGQTRCAPICQAGISPLSATLLHREICKQNKKEDSYFIYY
jgi:hypothetical protein